jgi:hypothetical protein
MKQFSKPIVRIISWSLIGTFVIFTTIALVAFGQGYRFDFKKRQLVGGGLILLNSDPANAEIYIDGQKRSKNTAARLLMPAGTYTIKLVKSGYRDWVKTINVTTTRISDIRYPLLVPNDITTRALKEFAEPIIITTASANRERLAMVEGGSSQTIYVVTTKNNTVEPLFNLPSSLKQKRAKIETIKWAPDDKHLLVTARADKVFNYFLLDSEDKNSIVDLTQQIDGEVFDLSFDPDDWRQIYWRTSKNVYNLNISNLNRSIVYAKPVMSIWIVSDAVWLVEPDPKGSKIIRIEAGSSQVFADTLKTGSYMLRVIDYSQNSYLAVTNSSTEVINLYLIQGENLELLHSFSGVSQPVFIEGPNSRFLLIKNYNNMLMYDFEYKRFDSYDFGNRPVESASWFDGFHVLATLDTKAFMFEFDGANKEDLFDVAQGSAISVDPNHEQIYSIGKSHVSEQNLLQVSDIAR